MTSTRAKSRAVFIDRDGTIMHAADYCSDPKQVQIFKGAAAALSRLKKAGYKIIVITNQSGIGRGFFTEKQYRAVEAEVARQLGDKEIDAECAHNAGVRAIRVRTGFDKMTADSCADWVAEDIPAAAEIILKATK